MTETPISAIDYGIDRKELAVIKDRFLKVNAARLERTQSALPHRQRLFLELLPLLFHVNHPMLPGYISHQTPFGISLYTPSKYTLQAAQGVARSFTYRFQTPVDQQILGLFLMGSSGTVAQSDRSDMDIWVCHSPEVDQEGRRQLNQKAEAISLWAASIGVEAHCFIMNSEKFRLGERENLSGEDCGSSQHYLLLDEFYRTGLLIAGRIPIWWLAPPNEDQNYDYFINTLRDKRFINPDDTLDFGGINQIPAGEFVGAGIWQLYKGIDSPYKSALKILLSEVYADEYPNIKPLSHLYKQAIYNNKLNIDELDPYVMVYRKLERYLLKREEYDRLELIRRCFYFKIQKPLTKPSTHRQKSWQRELLEQLTQEWNWPREHLLNLDARDKWKIVRVTDEQHAVVRELTNSYRFLVDFARRTQATSLINSQDMTVLGRKLYAAFERKAGKVEWINPGISADLSEEKLSFYYLPKANNQGSWFVTTESLLPKDIYDHDALKSSDSLISLLVWCHFNGLLDSATRSLMIKGEHQVTDFELHNIIRSIQKLLPIANQFTHDEKNHDCFSRPMRPIQLQLFINIGVDPLAQLRNQGIERLSNHTDSFGYSGMRENLVINIEQVLVNSWGEVSTQRYDGESALLLCLRDYLTMIPPAAQQNLIPIDIHCFCASRATAIKSRVEDLFSDINHCFYSGNYPASSRYILEIQRDNYIIQLIDQQPSIENVGNSKELIDYLGNKQSCYSPIFFDRFCQLNSPLRCISEKMTANTVQVFYFCRPDSELADIYVVDELGSFSAVTAHCINKDNFLTPLDIFLQSTLFRQNNDTLDLQADLNTPLQDTIKTVEYYELKLERKKIVAISGNPINHEGCPNFFNVQAIGSRNSNGQLLFNIYCDQKEFSEQQLGDELFTTVANYILQRRPSKARYPCYLTDLDLSLSLEQQGHAIQTSRYLYVKKRLEQSLNMALLAL